MLKITEKKFSIESNGLTKMNRENQIMQGNLRIFYKLWKIFTFITLKSPGLKNQRFEKIRRKKSQRWKFCSVICSNDFVSYT